MPFNIEVIKRVGKNIRDGSLEEAIEFIFSLLKRKNYELSVAIVGDSEMQKLNRDYREKDKTTDVLSFTYEKSPLNGEIILCLPQIKRQAKENQNTWEDELIVMLIHGILHLCGYDHKKDKVTREKMKKKEKNIIKKVIEKKIEIK